MPRKKAETTEKVEVVTEEINNQPNVISVPSEQTLKEIYNNIS